jgi:DNA glycosylase AlkZ-like
VSPGAERVLSQRELNRAVLARQVLLERARTPLPKALERVGGIQAQYAPSMYIGLWSRLRGFERDKLTRALERRSVVQATLMRVTIHLVSAADFWPLAVGIREARRKSWLRARKDVSATELEAAAKRTTQLLKDGPRSRAELTEDLDARLFNGVGVSIDLVRVPPAGTWERRRADIYATAESWLGPGTADRDEGIELVIRRYLQGFGPGAPADIANWAGLPNQAVAPVLDRMELRSFRSEDGALLVDLPRLPLPSADTPAPPRFLPTWDSTLLVHCRRTQILPEEHRPKLFHTKTPQSSPSFLVDGAVAGKWRYENGRVRLEPFGKLARADRQALEAEAEGLAALHV